MDGSAGDRSTFVCPACGTTREVDGPTKEAILETGCVVCGADVTRAAFSSADS